MFKSSALSLRGRYFNESLLENYGGSRGEDMEN